jgi:hypothetical protein
MYCFSCEKKLTPENTTTYGGFDGANYNLSNLYGHTDKECFTNCDGCFEADIDRHLENLYN